MFPYLPDWLRIVLAIAVALIISLLSTPLVKNFAENVGAVDQPNERRINKIPIPRMGGIAIFFGFMASMLLFTEISKPVTGIIIGSLIIAAMGALDDIVSLNPWIKLAFQIIAAAVAAHCGLVFDAISNPNILSEETTIFIAHDLAVFLTFLWIVSCTNAVNLIDGLDGLAVGVSAISSVTMLVVSIMVSEVNVSVILAAIVGACIGFMPYNLNPAKIFMGDVGSQLLGYVLATVSMLGLFKMHAIITFLVPVLALAVPLADTIFAFFRRIFHGHSPFHPDKGHFHHRLLAMGLSQKQAVAVLYGISAVLGLFCVTLSGTDPLLKIIGIAASFLVAISIWFFALKQPSHVKNHHEEALQPVSFAPKTDHDVKIYKKMSSTPKTADEEKKDEA